MRLRSSQFVFLLLLACSVQIRQDHALRLIAAPVLSAGQLREIAAVAAQHSPASSNTPRPTEIVSLTPSALAQHREPRPMPYPASASASVTSFTSLRRA